MPDWDADSARLTGNLAYALWHAQNHADQRSAPTTSLAREWHAIVMDSLQPPDTRHVGAFRGEPGLELVGVRVSSKDGTPPHDVAGELDKFVAKLAAVLDALDTEVPVGAVPSNEDQLDAVLDVCGWAHAEWVRIHPFANGNGRTARLWVNYIAMRYRLPPFMRLRPRPGAEYGDASAAAMEGNWQPTVSVIRTLYLEAVRNSR